MLLRAGADIRCVDQEYQNVLHWTVHKPVPFTDAMEEVIRDIFLQFAKYINNLDYSSK